MHFFLVNIVLLLLCRNGKQIDFLGLNENYNFEMQQIINLGNIKTIKQVSPHYLHGHILCPCVTRLVFFVGY